MTCYFPMKAYPSLAASPETGKHGRTFSGTKALIEGTLYTLPCGVCLGCRIDRAEDWAIRASHEATMCRLDGTGSAFLTLTFDNDHLPSDNSIRVETFQKFVRDLRYAVKADTGKHVVVRYLGCGEYGGRHGRAHYHALIFGYDFPDRRLFKVVNRERLFTSDLLSKVWPFGMATLGAVTFKSARYVASYVMKKVGGDRADAKYQRIDAVSGEVTEAERERAFMSRRPGLGASWFQKFKGDVYPGDFVVVDGRPRKPPRFYDQQLSADELERVRRVRSVRARMRGKPEDRTKARMWVRHEIAQLRIERIEWERAING